MEGRNAETISASIGTARVHADPQPPRHIGQLWIGFFGGHLTRFERHAADWARAWSITHNLRMHRAGVFSPLGRCSHGRRFKRHAALRAAARPRLLDLWMHGAGVFPLRLGLGWRVRGSCVRLSLQVFLWRGAKLCGAALATEVESGALMFNGLPALLRDRPSSRIRDRALQLAAWCDCGLVRAIRSAPFCSISSHDKWMPAPKRKSLRVRQVIVGVASLGGRSTWRS
jgi:hypothetical protein